MNSIYNNKRPTIGVMMPILSGFYMGEINATFRQLASQNNVNLIFIRTSKRSEFNLPVGLEHLDALIVLLHCASSELVKNALKRDIPVLSMGASYSPLRVEQFYSNQAQGVAQLYQHLTQQGHQNIGFCGDLSIGDVRDRFNAFKQVKSELGHPMRKHDVFPVSNCALTGGRQGAVLFQQSESDCTAVICATDHNAVGMIEQFAHIGKKVPSDIAVVGIDNIFLGNQMSPRLTSIDQQLEPLTARVFQRALELIQGAEYSNEITALDQKLVVRDSCSTTEINRDEPQETGIRNALLASDDRSSFEIFESFYSLAHDGFSAILDAQSVYDSPLKWACYASADTKNYQIDSWVEKGMTQPTTLENSANISDKIVSFPFLNEESQYIATVMPVTTGEPNQWKLLGVVDSVTSQINIHKVAMFNNYLDMLALFVQRDALVETSSANEQQSQQLLEELEVVSNSSNDGLWELDADKEAFRFNGRMLSMLGLSDEHSMRSFKVQEVMNLVLKEDRQALKETFTRHFEHNAPLKLQFRIRTYQNKVLWVNAAGSAIRNTRGHTVKVIGSVTDVTEQRNSAEQIRVMAYYDALTGVANRRKIIEVINQEIEQSPQQPRAVMLMDLNRFKFINDSYGHHVGDALLKHVTKQLSQNLDTTRHHIARLGGDEFLLFCDVTNKESALELGKEILNYIKVPMQYQGLSLIAMGSLGVAMYPADASTPDVLIKRADIAMYQAKRDGKDEPTSYREQDEAQLLDALKMEHHLKEALNKDEISLHYQPLFSLDKNQFVAVESLARWQSPILGHVAPHQFVSLAEEVNLISQLGELLINKICEDIKVSPYLQATEHISVNISAKQLIEDNFASQILTIIASHQIEVCKFCFEVTETAAISDFDKCFNALTELHEAGAKISLDDFGSGFSSLSLLQKLPIDEIKIDRSFVKDIVTNQQDLKFVKAIVSMAHGIGLRVVIEGVETKKHLEQLENLGAELLQGYHFATPMPVFELNQQM